MDHLRRTGKMLFSDQLDSLLRQLDEALFLEGPRFEARWRHLTAAYRRAPARPIRDGDALGPPSGDLAEYIDRMTADARPAVQQTPPAAGRISGLIAPHLDYPRGEPCYAAAYRRLAERTDAVRFVILGTNHFGRARGVVGTRKDFQSPFGVVPHDADFMQRIDRRCGRDLCQYEYDHAREHSVELQAVLLKRLLAGRAFKIAAYLCPDPCGPTGTAPSDRAGVDLRDFAAALREEIAADGVPARADRQPVTTCIIAGADLSHVGRFFHDDRDLDAEQLAAVEALDRRALRFVERGDAEGFRKAVADRQNDTHICSVGCIYAATAALAADSRPRLLHYHQAIIPEAENCVTCAAMEFCSPRRT